MNPANALMKAVYETLLADAALTAVLGAGRIHDDPPRAAEPPFAVIAATGLAPQGEHPRAEEHSFEIVFWSGLRGRKQATAMADAARRALETAPALAAPHRLANLEFVSWRIARDAQTGWHRADVRYRAVTETA